MYVGSLFSGIGGIELGFQCAGFKTKWFIENDEYCQKILKKNFPNTIIYDDITKIDFRTVPKVSILTGGFPCQDISSAGKGIGINGSRSSLWKYYKEAIRVLQPKYAFIENVPMLNRRGLNVVLADIASIGYDAEWYCVSASSIGAPHQRDRLFIIAYLQSKRKRNIPEEQQGRCEFDSCGNPSITDTDSNRRKKMPKRKFNKSNTTRVETIIQKDASNTKGFLQERSIAERDNDGKSKKEIGNRSMYDTDSWQIGMWKQGVLQRNSVGLIETESGVCGVADGISNRVDRIRCLGNAVVPQLAEVFANAIKEMESKLEQKA